MSLGSKPRIGMMSHWFDPEGGAAAQPGVIARSLLALGHEVAVVTGFPNYPGGQVHDGYRLRIRLDEIRDGVQVHRTWLYPSHDRSALRRVVNYLSFGVSSVPTSLRRLKDVDVALVYASPATAAFGAMALKWRHKVPYVVHVPDLWPESVLQSGFLPERINRVVGRFLHAGLDRMYRSSAAVTVTSPGQADRIQDRGVPSEKIHFIPNWVDEDVFHPRLRDPALRAALGIRADVVVMYAGNLGRYQSLDTLLQAAELVRDDESILFLLLGDGVERPRLESLVRSKGLNNVRFLGVQPYREMSQYLALGDLHVVSLSNLPLFEHTLPSKLAATMASGKPVLASLTGDGARLVRDAGAGYVVPPEQAEAMADAIRQFQRASPQERQSLGEKANRYYRDNLSASVVASRLSSVLVRASSGGGRKDG